MPEPTRPQKKFHEHLLHHARRGYHHAKHFLIPHVGNNHKPHALRAPALRMYVFAIIAVKVFVTSFLFLSYPSAGKFAEITGADMVSLTNASRATENLAPLKSNAKLNQAAMLKAQHMMANDYFAHTAPDGTKPWTFFKEAGYSYSTAGENLAMDFTDAAAVEEAFMNSPSHRQNIMNVKYTEIGIAVLDGQLQGHETTLLVVFFGAPYQAAAAPTTVTPPATKPTTQPTTTPSKPTTTKPTQTQTPPPAPVFQAQLTDQSAKDLGIKPLERIGFWVEFKNTGNTTWQRDGQYFVALNVSNPAGRTSKFQDETWKEYYRPALLSQSSVKPGQIGRFEFTLKAPEEAGSYEEDFSLVAENLTWISGGSIELPIVAVAPPEQATEMQVQAMTTPTETTPEATPPATTTPTNTEPPTTGTPSGEEPAEQTLASDQQQAPVVQVQTVETKTPNAISTLIEYSHKFYGIFLIFLLIALLLNIVIEIRVQHPHLIVQSIVVIIIAVTALTLNGHFLESIPRALKII